MEPEPFWIFGYGSLIWKHPPSYVRRVPCYIKGGYIRRFWQASEDHRGTPEAPGRVVTLVKHDTKEPLWGAAYLIAPTEVQAIKTYLDIREINGYTSSTIELYHDQPPSVPVSSSADATGIVTVADPSLPNPIKATVYIGTPENPQFVGPPKSTFELAQHILHSKGPSGENREYLYNLQQALEELSPEAHDIHISELAEMVRGLERQNLPQGKV